jgi:serine phosphatase RsbU (regulator of sigma subunit)
MMIASQQTSTRGGNVPEPVPPVGVLFRAARPDGLVEVARDYARARYGAADLEALLADYRISGLWPVLQRPHRAAGPLAERSAAARCFGSQQPVVDETADGTRLFVPLTAWGERIGVLVLDFPTTAAPDPLDELRTVADELAVALIAADRSTDRYRRARRRQRMTMAAEMQWDMLPGRSLAQPGFLLAGQLEPAYAVCGDHFDWSLLDSRLTITVLNGDGQGIDATVVTALAVNAMRNARRSGGDLIEQAELASDIVFSQYAGERHVATLLMEVELDTGAVRAIDAGSPRAVRLRSGELHPVELDRQLPLGMFGEIRYEPQHLHLQPGDRFVVVSDGVHGARPGAREAYGDRALATAVRRTRLQPATEAVGSLMRSLHEYHRGEDLRDDAVIVCLDWHRTSRVAEDA